MCGCISYEEHQKDLKKSKQIDADLEHMAEELKALSSDWEEILKEMEAEEDER